MEWTKLDVMDQCGPNMTELTEVEQIDKNRSN